jgi:DNA-binding MarR family transcriptional regulator
VSASGSRLPIGQLLVRMLRRFRADLFQRGQEAGYADIREAHLQVFGNIDWSGTRLTDLAARANMTRPSMAELVDDLERVGYLERRPDPIDGRAKLICLTRAGRRVVSQALRAVRDIERGYAQEVGPERFEAMCLTLQALVEPRAGEGRQGRTQLATAALLDELGERKD